jgi:hypothetical protein
MELVVPPTGLASRSVALAIVVGLHIILVVLAIKSLSVRKMVDAADQPLFYVKLTVKPISPSLHIVAPDFSQIPPAISLDTAVINSLQIDGDVAADDAEPSYKLPIANSDKYQHLFDPRIRERLQNLKHFTKSKTRSVDGVQILDLGNGECELTTVGRSAAGRPSESVTVKCGNNESEQMIENMEKALADPLGLK